MYQIQEESFGIKFTFSDFLRPEELRKWFEESKSTLENRIER
jgi:hypothetical protein